MTNQDGNNMPLNQKQRDLITPYIEHFFYDLKSGDLATLRHLKTALEKPFVPVVAEQKEHEEKLTEAEAAFNDLTQLITKPQEKIKKHKVYGDGDKKDVEIAFEELNAERTTIDDVIEYIVFYSLCCVQFHLQQSDTDDFHLNSWLAKLGITEAELNTSWELNWLKKIGTEKTLAAINWDINTTVALLNQSKNNNPYVTTLHPIDHDIGSLDWSLPALKGRTYSAKILPKMENLSDKDGKVIEVSATLDLQIVVYISPQKTLSNIIPNFTPYPNALAIPNETEEQRQHRDRLNNIRQSQVKDYAEALAETIATGMTITHLKNIGIPKPPVPVILLDLGLAEASIPADHLSEDNAEQLNLPTTSNNPSGSDLPLDNEVEENSNSNTEELLRLPQIADDEAIGFSLLTYQFYLDEFKAGRLDTNLLQDFTSDETETLSNEAILRLIAYRHLTISSSLELPQHVSMLLKNSPHYFNYICENLDGLQYIKQINVDQPRFCS
jgi:hypothetical protein